MTGIIASMLGGSVVTTSAFRTAKTITAYGNAQISTAQNKFGGSSILFDGAEDYLVVSTNPLPTSGDFTVELWFRPSAIGTLRPIWSNRDTGGTNRGVLYINTAGQLTWWNGGDNLNHTTSLVANNWYHIAAVRSSGIRRLFVSGANMVTDSFSYTAGDVFQIGKADYTSSVFTDEIIGNIDDFRVSNIARYTANFTPPTNPFINDTNTVLLIHGDGANASTSIVDDIGNGVGRSRIAWTTQGNAQLDTAQSKFGGSSLLLDGNGDYLTTGLNGSLTLGTSDHTIEGFIRLDSAINNRNTIISNNVASFTTNWMKLGVDLSGGSYYLQFIAYDYSSGGSPVITSSVALSLSTWYHVALVRSSTEWYMYIDGTQRGSNITSTAKGITANWNANSGTQIGRYSFDNGANPGSTYYDGWIDSMRISNTARYTANFTAPTSELTNDSNTLLLLKFDGADASTTITDDNS